MLTDEWQPIETAPRDEMILGYADDMMRILFFEGGVWKLVGATIEANWFEPTHWMPLPPPPMEQTDAD